MGKKPIFDENRLALARQRSSKIAARLGAEHHGFLHKEAAQILGERLAATKRKFGKPVLLFDGPFADLVETTILQENPPVSAPFLRLAPITSQNPVLDIKPESCDLVVSVFDLHRVNDLGALLLQVNLALKPDGLFLAVVPAAGTLVELQKALVEAELETTRGAAMRVDPFPHIKQIGDLLQRTGFRLPVCDLEERIIRYNNLKSLADDLRGGGMNGVMTGNTQTLSRRTWHKAEERYREIAKDGDSRLRASAALSFLSGWKEDVSQQKPLKPGSASHHMKDFL